jgi:Cation/multidrug efflux pump
MRIQADTRAMASYGIDLSAVRTAIGNANANSAKGSFDGASRSYSINANDQLVSVDDYKSLIVSYKNGAPVRLTDIAQVVDSAENLRLAAWADDTPAIIVNVQRQPGANVIQTVDAIKKQLPSCRPRCPRACRCACSATAPRASARR